MKTKTMTTIKYFIGNVTANVLHFEGEIKKSQLPVALRNMFEYTNHLEDSELVLANQLIPIGKDVTVEVDIDDVNAEDIIFINKIVDILNAHKKMYMLEGLKLTAAPKKVAVIKRRVRA